MAKLEDDFDDQVMAVYENGKRVLGYNATRFLQKLRSDGGLAAAKSWLSPRKRGGPTNGFLKLVDAGRLELSLEALVLEEPWSSLFTTEELGIARSRLSKYGYFEPETDIRDRSDMLSEEVDGTRYPEGAVKSVLVNRYERNSKARTECIKHYGPKCYVCDFDFEATYGSEFEGYIHVHHLCPVSSLGRDYSVDPIADLRPVCPNCHAAIHRTTPCLSIDHIRALIQNAAD